MAWLAVDEDGFEFIYDDKPERYIHCWSIWRRNFAGETMIMSCFPKAASRNSSEEI